MIMWRSHQLPCCVISLRRDLVQQPNRAAASACTVHAYCAFYHQLPSLPSSRSHTARIVAPTQSLPIHVPLQLYLSPPMQLQLCRQSLWRQHTPSPSPEHGCMRPPCLMAPDSHGQSLLSPVQSDLSSEPICVCLPRLIMSQPRHQSPWRRHTQRPSS